MPIPSEFPPQRPLACSVQVQEEAKLRHFIPQTGRLSFSSTRRLIKVASIRLLQGMSFGSDLMKKNFRTISVTTSFVLTSAHVGSIENGRHRYPISLYKNERKSDPECHQ